MPYSIGYYKENIRQHFLENVAKNSKILDAGAGCGTYSVLLKEHFPNMDGLEIFAEYDKMFDLKSKYDNLFIADILEFDVSGYDYVILGDIIEHLSVENAQRLLNEINDRDILCMVGVPYMFEQGPEFNNVHETHLQPDLTHEVFMERYPHMKLFWKNEAYGYYVNYDYNG